MEGRTLSRYRIAVLAMIAALVLLVLATAIKGLAIVVLIVAVAIAASAYLRRRRERPSRAAHDQMTTVDEGDDNVDDEVTRRRAIAPRSARRTP